VWYDFFLHPSARASGETVLGLSLDQFFSYKQIHNARSEAWQQGERAQTMQEQIVS
jgi:hypothetical protein